MDQKVTVPAIRARKGGEKISALTAYDYPTGWLLDAAGIDVVLVGDSLASTVLGYPSTIPVELSEMLAAVRAVRRGVRRALLVGDMPFGSYHGDPGRAVEAAVAFLKAGAEAVKIEGGQKRASLVRRFVENEIPVMGHIGLTPQSVHAMGGYRVQGKTPAEAERLICDAEALERAGAFSIVLEGIPAEVSARITAQVRVPTIGIGAGPATDGQILVLNDLLGLTVPVPSLPAAPGAPAEAGAGRVHKPRFVREYLDLRSLISAALERYVDDVRRGRFPSEKESYRMAGGDALPREAATSPGAIESRS
jgi:3-methyl-2-oxobutanoate hydroxymethyltransferase